MKALCVTYGGGHVEMCLPVIKALRAQLPRCDIRLVALTTAWGAAKAAGEAPLGFRDFTAPAQAALVRRYGELLLAGNEHPAVQREESIAYLGVNFLEWVEDLGEAAAFERWRTVGRQGFMPVRFFRRLLERERPDVVFSTNSPRSEEAAVAAAVALGIPSLSMVDLFALPGDAFLRRRVHADRIAVLCDATRANLVAAGVDPARIVVTGNPAFDALMQPAALAAAAAWRRERRWVGRPVVLWAGHREPADAPAAYAGTALGDAVLRRLADWAAARDDVCLAVRYHPNEWHQFARPPAHPRMHWSEPGAESLVPVLLGADQVIVQATTVGAQAAAAGKRVIALGFSPLVQRSGMDYGALGLGDSAGGIDQMIELASAGLTRRASAPGPGWSHAAAEAVASEIAALAARKEPA